MEEDDTSVVSSQKNNASQRIDDEQQKVRENLHLLCMVSSSGGSGEDLEEHQAETMEDDYRREQNREPSLRHEDLLIERDMHRETSSSLSSSFSMDDNKLSSSMTALERQHYAGLLPWEKLDHAQSPDVDIHNTLDPIERVKNFIKAVPVNYKVIKTLGLGHNGMVFAAREVPLTIDEENSSRNGDDDSDGGETQKELERRVAIKVLSSQRPGHRSRKLREMTALTFIPPHPNIVKLLSRPLSSQGYEYFIMELCDRSLDDWMKEQHALLRIQRASTSSTNKNYKHRPALEAADTVRILFQLCDAVVLLRKFGITHRDIKPANILLSYSKTDTSFSVKLADFGVADMMVGGTPTRYENFIGAIPEAASRTKEYTSEDDFRAVVATVFFAWIAEADWEEKRLHLFTDLGFTKAATKLRLNTFEWQILKFFERALPTDQKDQTGEMLSLDEAVNELKDLGRVLGMNLGSKADAIGIDDELLKYGGNLDDMKLNAYCCNAIDYASGRRQAKDFKTAKEYVDHVEDLLDMFEGEVPAARRASLFFQKGLILLPELHAALREYSRVSGNTRLSRRNQGHHSLRVLGKKVERALRDVRSAFREGLCWLPEVTRDCGWDGPGRSQFVNQEVAVQLEEVKYYILTQSWDKAKAAASVGLETVGASLDSFLNDAGGESVISPQFELVVFQHRRQKYLLQHELMKIDYLRDGTIREGLVEDAMKGCRRGVGNIYRTKEPKPGDVLEMNRCYAEALYIGKCYEEARGLCEKLFEDYGNIRSHRVGIARVLALWIAALDGLNKDEYKKELGYVYGVFTNMHILSAKDMCRNVYFVPNARAFLTLDRSAALAYGADPLLPVPLIPSDDVFIRDKADKALEAVELAVAEIEEEESSL